MPPNYLTPREEYRQRERERTNASPLLLDRFSHIKALTLELSHYTADGCRKTSQLKYSVNLEAARSVFSFECSNEHCIDGGFDLSDEIRDAVAAHMDEKEGQVSCQGWKSKTTVGSLGCGHQLRYLLNLEFEG